MICNVCNQIIHTPFNVVGGEGDGVAHVTCPKKDDVESSGPTPEPIEDD